MVLGAVPGADDGHSRSSARTLPVRGAKFVNVFFTLSALLVLP